MLGARGMTMGSFADLVRSIFGGGSRGTGRSGGDEGMYFYVKLTQSGEIVELRLIPRQELVPDYQAGGYFSHKVITGPRTLARATALFRFDENRRFSEAEIEGGELSDEDEYRAVEQTSR
jgi:hypothetical protein